MEKIIILQGIKPDDLLNQINLLFETKLTEILKQFKPEETTKFLTRKEVCQLLKISLPTLHNWTKEGMVKSYKIGTRVLYKTTEIEEALGIKKNQRFRY